jgi:peptide deformylase
MYFINPVIVKKSRETQVLEEGCLSIRYLYGKVRRSKKITVRAYDENGVLFERGASGLLAQIIQHENDHLDGILFVDKAMDVEEILPENEHD